MSFSSSDKIIRLSFEVFSPCGVCSRVQPTPGHRGRRTSRTGISAASEVPEILIPISSTITHETSLKMLKYLANIF